MDNYSAISETHSTTGPEAIKGRRAARAVLLYNFKLSADRRWRPYSEATVADQFYKDSENRRTGAAPSPDSPDLALSTTDLLRNLNYYGLVWLDDLAAAESEDVAATCTG